MSRQARIILVATPCLLASGYLSGGAVQWFQFALFVAGVLVPLAGLLIVALRRLGLDDALNFCLAACLAIITITPLYFLRRAIPLPAVAADVLLALVLTMSCTWVGGYRRLRESLASRLFAAALPLLAMTSLIFVLVWMGFEVRAEMTVQYYGLFPVDFNNLALVTALVKSSPGLPLGATAGDGPLNYHWLYFALPAWMSEFAGINGRSAATLILCNALVAPLLLLAMVLAVTQELAPDPRTRRVAVMATALASLAPFSTYAYQTVIAAIGAPWFTVGTRNSLMLSPVNSMVAFGNNTVALALAVLLCALVRKWNDSLRISLAAVCGFMLTALIGYSATLFVPLAAALGAWTLIGRVRKPWLAAIGAAPAMLVGVAILHWTNVLGASKEKLVFSFDSGQFLQNVMLGLAPVLVFAAISLFARRRLSIWWLLMAACVAVPTFLALAGSRTGDVALSMKTASLLAVASAPVVAIAMEYLLTRWREQRLLATLAVGIIAVGIVNTTAYTFQFATARLTGRGSKATQLPLDYVVVLDWLRVNTPSQAIVIDPFSNDLPDTIATLVVAERRVWLPTVYGEAAKPADARARSADRLALFSTWRNAGYPHDDVPRSLASQADYLILPAGVEPAPAWKLVTSQPAYAAFVSQLRARGSRRPQLHHRDVFPCRGFRYD